MVTNSKYQKDIDHVYDVASFYRDSLIEANAENERLTKRIEDLLVENIMLKNENERLYERFTRTVDDLHG